MKKKTVVGMAVMLLSLIADSAVLFAATSGKCGDKITWTLDEAGNLELTGSGEMFDYNYQNGVETPWGTAIKSLSLNGAITNIGAYAFAGCRGLTSVKIPKSVERVGESAFQDCSSLTSVDLPSSVKCIGVSAFYKCNLTCVEIPSSVTSIGEFAFYDCGNLRSVRITDLAAWCKINFVNYYANPLCYGSNLYLNGEELTDLTIPSSVEVVGAYAFAGCGGLANVEIGNSVKRIEVSAFRNCRGLKSVKIPNSVGGRVFVRCKNLANVDIPSSVNGIRDYAFYGCTGLTKIEVLAKVPPICGMKVFYGLDKNKCELMVPIESIEAYKTAGTWNDFMKITAGVGCVDSDDASMTVTVHDGEIIISGKTVNDAVVEVYDMHGIFVYRGKSRSIVVPRDGIYAVRIGSRVEKVAVK